ncbi:hypothetical protein BV25DRAFT_1988751 [Artomyces pyxidatus]|uniref:Uncharacterized protein n=1 Tax=Artomyces pyxidatus TaxID=48021 RepID=A0ACB8TDB9_9AGAM|nr:hypothetical protein BV25DRAFT_1988751 [Artomyces pyxidatus]
MIKGAPTNYSGGDSDKLFETRPFFVDPDSDKEKVAEAFWSTVVQEWEKATGKSVEDCAY